MNIRILIAIVVVLVILPVVLIATDALAASSFERSYIARLHVTAVPQGEVTHLHIRGVPTDSFCKGATQLEVKATRDEVWQKAKLRYLRDGGPFDYVLTVPSSTKRVLFGNKKTEIWPKDAGGPIYSEKEQKALDIAIRAFDEKPDLSVDDYYVGINKGIAESSEEPKFYMVTFYQDGPAPSCINEIHKYRVSTSDDSATYEGKTYAGQGMLLQQLGKLGGTLGSFSVEPLTVQQLK